MQTSPDHTLPSEWADLINDFQEHSAQAQMMGGDAKLEKRRTAGKLNARERVELLVDPGSFTEIGSMVGMVEYQGMPAAPADALVCGLA